MTISPNPKCKECKGKGELTTKRGAIVVKRPCNCVPRPVPVVVDAAQERGVVPLPALKQILVVACAGYRMAKDENEVDEPTRDASEYQWAIEGLALVESLRASIQLQISDEALKAQWESLV